MSHKKVYAKSFMRHKYWCTVSNIVAYNSIQPILSTEPIICSYSPSTLLCTLFFCTVCSLYRSEVQTYHLVGDLLDEKIRAYGSGSNNT